MNRQVIALGHRQLQRIGLRHCPPLILDSGPDALSRFIEFFTAYIRNRNTREVYARAVSQFCRWCELLRVAHLHQISPFVVATYVEQLGQRLARPTVKQHLAAISMLFDFLVVGQVLPMNPASSVKGPKHVVKKGKTPVLSAEEARTLLNSVDTTTIGGLRDRALIGVMVYSFARVSAVVAMNVEDFFPQGKSFWFRLHEKGGKRHDVPAHHKATEYVDSYVAAAGIAFEKKGPLFRSLDRKRQLTERRLTRREVLAMVKRHARQAGIPASTCCHTFRATGITAYLNSGGTLELAQRIAGHESPRTTKLYDRTADNIDVAEIEKIGI